MTMLDFVLARMAADEAREFEESGLPVEVAEKTMWGAATRLSYAMRRLGYALAWSLPLRPFGYRTIVRSKARQYADHPDYREGWRTA